MIWDRKAQFFRTTYCDAARAAFGRKRADADFAKLLGILVILSLSCVFVAERFFPD